MIEMDLHEKNYFDVCQHYKHSYETPRIKQDQEKMKQALKYVVLYLALSPYNNEQSDFLHRLFLDKNLENIPKYKYEDFAFEIHRVFFVCLENYCKDLRLKNSFIGRIFSKTLKMI